MASRFSHASRAGVPGDAHLGARGPGTGEARLSGARGVGRTGVVAELGELVVAVSPFAPTWMHCRSWKRTTCRTSPKTTARCTLADMTCTPPWRWARPRCSPRRHSRAEFAFLFQPSEEVGDEQGISGAPRMIEDGAMEGVDMVIALHVDPATPVGSIHISDGPSSGGVDSWYGRIIGKGGHGAKPNEHRSLLPDGPRHDGPERHRLAPPPSI